MKKDFKKILLMVKENWNNYMKEFKKCFEDLKHKETFYKQIPNLLTASRALGMIPVNILFLTGNMVPGIILLGILLSTDFFDGKIARKYGIESKFGADLDAVCDKIMAVGLMIPLMVTNPIIILSALLEVLIASFNVMGRLDGIDTKTLFSGKVKTWFLSLTLGLGYLAKFVSFFDIIYVMSSILTFVVQCETAVDYERNINAAKRKKELEEINRELDMEQELLNKQNKIKELQKEKEFLLSMNEEKKENNKVKIRKK